MFFFRVVCLELIYFTPKHIKRQFLLFQYNFKQNFPLDLIKLIEYLGSVVIWYHVILAGDFQQELIYISLLSTCEDELLSLHQKQKRFYKYKIY